jgi:geranylgeranyl reductase family protein
VVRKLPMADPSDPLPAISAPEAGLPAPPHCDVVVVGAGPAGSAAALTLARAGVNVVMVDRHAFPRDKVCGDALIPDALGALSQLGVLPDVLARARQATALSCVSPRGREVQVPGSLAVLPRRQLDLLLCDAARAAGARLLAPATFTGLLRAGDTPAGRVLGVRLDTAQGGRTLHAPWVVLATGAASAPLEAAGACTRSTPSGMALRLYVRHAELGQTLRCPRILWHPRLRHGYGWLFPGPGDVFNLGTGYMLDGRGSGRRNLRQMLDALSEVHPLAARLAREGEVLGPAKGAPLRCTLRGAVPASPGLLVAGEAAGSTYALTGEGIGKALVTGIGAAQALLRTPRALGPGTPSPQADAQACADHAAQLRALQPRFDVYETAAIVNRWPWLAELVLWRAARSPRILARMSGVLTETQAPRLLTVRGLVKLLTE